MTLRPLHVRVLVKRLTTKDKTSGGLLILDTAREKPLEALIAERQEEEREPSAERRPSK
jgi:chaperonin GroES